MHNKRNIINLWQWSDYFHKKLIERDFPWITTEGWNSKPPMTTEAAIVDPDEESLGEDEWELPHMSINEREQMNAIQRREDRYKDGE